MLIIAINFLKAISLMYIGITLYVIKSIIFLKRKN